MPLVVSYFTPGTAYEDLAARLSASCRRLGLAHRVEPRASRGSWVENCAQKAVFVREMHQEERRPILWVDADGILRRPISELIGTEADFAVVKRDGWSFYGGQIYFGAGPGATRLLDRWCHYCVAAPRVWDQVSLGYAWWDAMLDGGVRSIWLPERGTSRKLKRDAARRVFQTLFSRAAILHAQESRRSKTDRLVSERTEFSTYDLPEWWREAARRDQPFALNEAQRAELGLGDVSC